MKEFVDNKYGQRKAQFFRDQVVSNAQAAMARMRADAVNNPEVFVDTPMAALGTSMYNGMSGQDILSMYDKKQKAYDSINPFNGLAQSFTDMTKYFNDPKYFAHKQEFYINDDYAKGLSEDDIANAFMRKGIGSDMAKTVAYDYFNPQQNDTTDISNMSRDDIKAMRQKERDNYRKMKQNQKDWFDSATYVGGYAPSYACGGIKKMINGGPEYFRGKKIVARGKTQDGLEFFQDMYGNRYFKDGRYYDAATGKVSNDNSIFSLFDTTDNGRVDLGYDYESMKQQNPYTRITPIYDFNNYNYAQNVSSTKGNESVGSKTSKPVTGSYNAPSAVTDTEVITGATGAGNNTGTISGNGTSATDTIDTGADDKDTSTGTSESTDSKTQSYGVTPPAAPIDTYGRSYINISTPWGTGRVFVDNNNIDVRRNGRRLAIWGDRNSDNNITNIPQQQNSDIIDTQIEKFNPELQYVPDFNYAKCGGVTKAALGMAIIDDEKYDNGNIPNTPIVSVNPVSWEPMMTVDTIPSKEDSAIPETENIKMRNDQADAATGIKNKNDYGYGISNAVWNGLMFAGNFAEKMRNDKNKLASVAANLNNTQTPVMAMRGYDPTVNPTHLGYDADPSRLSVLGRYKCGGRKYAKGGIYDLTANEIDEILKNGGKIEFIW